MNDLGADLSAYVEKLAWMTGDSGVVSIPPNPDNQIESTIVQENIQLPRTSADCPSSFYLPVAHVWLPLQS